MFHDIPPPRKISAFSNPVYFLLYNLPDLQNHWQIHYNQCMALIRSSLLTSHDQNIARTATPFLYQSVDNNIPDPERMIFKPSLYVCFIKGISGKSWASHHIDVPGLSTFHRYFSEPPVHPADPVFYFRSIPHLPPESFFQTNPQQFLCSVCLRRGMAIKTEKMIGSCYNSSCLCISQLSAKYSSVWLLPSVAFIKAKSTCCSRNFPQSISP